MHHGHIPQQFRGDVFASNLEIHKSIDGHPISHFRSLLVVASFPGEFGGDARTGSCDFTGCLLGIPSVFDRPLSC